MGRSSGVVGVSSMAPSIADLSRGPQLPPAPTSYPLYVRVRAVVADWEVSPEQMDDFLIVGPTAALDSVGPEENPGVQTIKATLQKENPRKRRSSRLGMVSGVQVANVLEHVLRDVIAGDEFGEIVDSMLSQETPFFIQYEDSPAPGD